MAFRVKSMVGQQKDELNSVLVNQVVSTLDDTDSFVFIKDTQHRYIGCNNTYARFLGLENKQRIVGLTDAIVNPQQADLYLQDDTKVLGGEKLIIDNPAFFKQYGKLQVSGEIIPVKNLNNDIIGIFGTTKLIFNIANRPFYSVMALLDANTIPIIVSKRFYNVDTNHGAVKLSKREVECILLLLKCITYEAIATSLQLSQRSVESYFVNIKNKLNVKQKNEIVDTVIKGGLLQQL